MSDILMDASTGFIPEDELVELAAEPDSIAVGTWQVIAATAATAAGVGAVLGGIGSISSSWGGGCPTTACTSRC
ncbi:class II lanthipeptide, LchA2/BrtA2 family [Kitasatospora cathayae]|uniref:Class II lanthipeptide, LchA2/BrtA2 family n=1 Tax=Kitasatospora cathayae TaxID=3004092 RepID=A0ABY7QDF8_9ACTN|nr:class II lanthipeptide, LchA2/BrtA2 family [Kitasatospora sp. HUAS 3-15]WBP90637.1 class II lanthipeptide, LchA2/BrtA2 family [Kitasatospora sp. HUAS 3-15]